MVIENPVPAATLSVAAVRTLVVPVGALAAPVRAAAAPSAKPESPLVASGSETNPTPMLATPVPRSCF